jgi:hemoglobin-like flavoprotein
MTPRQKTLVQSTWTQVVPIAETAAELFYGRLFELDPALRPLFKSDTKEQGRKLIRMIGVAVDGLDQLRELLPAVEDLGRRHAGYGVEDADYETVGAALLWTLDKGLGSGFTPEVEEAWATVYGLLATTMKDAAKRAAAAA